MNEKNQQLIWDLYVGITRDTQKTNGYYGNICRYCKECYKNLANTIDRYVGIAMNEECQQLFVAHMRVLQEMPQKLAAIMGLICGYCIFENLFMKFIIENDVGIICLKCVYCFKIL